MTASKRRDPFAHPADSWDGANDPLATIRMPEKKKRERRYEAENKTYVYRAPVGLDDEVFEIREKLKSIVAFDDTGNLRADRTTVDDVARVLVGYALDAAEKECLTFTPTKKGKMKLEWEDVEQGWEKVLPIELKKVAAKKKKIASPQVLLGYRWSEEVHAQIEVLAGKVREVETDATGRIKNNPHRYVVPIGEVVVRLLQRGISDYVNRKMRLISSQETVSQKVMGWTK